MLTLPKNIRGSSRCQTHYTLTFVYPLFCMVDFVDHFHMRFMIYNIYSTILRCQADSLSSQSLRCCCLWFKMIDCCFFIARFFLVFFIPVYLVGISTGIALLLPVPLCNGLTAFQHKDIMPFGSPCFLALRIWGSILLVLLLKVLWQKLLIFAYHIIYYIYICLSVML